MSVSLLVCYFLTEIIQIWGYLHFLMRYLSEIFLRHSWDIGSLVFTMLGWAYILTFECLCAVLNFETSHLVFFLGLSSDIGSLVFTLLGWAYILTFEFLCAGLNFETSCLVTFWFSWGQLLNPLVLFLIDQRVNVFLIIMFLYLLLWRW